MKAAAWLPHSKDFVRNIILIILALCLISSSSSVFAAAKAKKAGAKKGKAKGAAQAPAQPSPQAVMFFPWLNAPDLAALGTDENRLIAILQSDDASTPTLARKDMACAVLKRVGTAACIPALAALLADPGLSHTARYALEANPDPAAGKALADALDKTDGLIRAGLLQSLGQRREASAIQSITPFLADADPAVAQAAAFALGRIGNDAALKALKDGYAKADKPAQINPITDALLTLADAKLAGNDRAAAAAIYSMIGKTTLAPHLITAAVRGTIRSAKDDNDAILKTVQAITSSEPPVRTAGLQMARELKSPAATRALCELAPKLPVKEQVAVVEAMRQRGDAEAADPLVAMLDSDAESVRVAILTALGELGGTSAVVPLAKAAAGGTEPEKKAARQALLTLHRDQVSLAMLDEMKSGDEALASEIIRALVGRGDHGAVPGLIEAAQARPAAAKAALAAAGQLAGATHVSPLVKFIQSAQNDEARAAAAEAMRSVLRRLRAQNAAPEAQPIVAAIEGAPPETRLALLAGAAPLADPRLREALRSALKETDPALRAAALKALAETCDPELLPDLQSAAAQAADPAQRALAVRGLVRLATEESGTSLTSAQRVEALRGLIRGPGGQSGPSGQKLSTEDKFLVLSGLSRVPDPAALDLALPLLEDPATRAEAAQAAVAIASKIQATQPDAARAALRKVVAAGLDPAQIKSAQEALTQIDALAGFITAWEAAGPFTKDGMAARALFDVAFPPESPDAKINWARLPAGTLAGKPNILDLLAPIGGDSRVAYARTRIFSEKAQPARLEFGYDDGIKAWFNGAPVYQDNYQGPLKAGAGKADVELKQGWNVLLLKIVQNNQMWEFCARMVSRDGGPLEGVRIDAALGGGKLLQPAPTPPPVAAPSAPSPVKFQKKQLDPVFRSEGIGVADFNKDGKLDLCTGNWLYLGPDWKPLPISAKALEYDPKGYSQEFYVFPHDIDADGWIDAIVVGFPGQATRWMKNPGAAENAGHSRQEWPTYLAIDKTGNESPDWLDVDGDGKKELVFIGPKGMALARPGADPTQPWPIVPIADVKDPRPGHGIGVGDLNGDKRLDILCPEGWWEAPADRKLTPWPFHAVKFGEVPPAQMCVYDFDGDGDADVLTSGAHKYGMWWYEQKDGAFTEHVIDQTISQLHALHLADLDGDGLLDIVTGKRFWAHTVHDDGINDPAVLTWFRLERKDGKPVWTRHDLDQDSGVGLHVAITDLNGDGKLDIATSHKKGVYVFMQE